MHLQSQKVEIARLNKPDSHTSASLGRTAYGFALRYRVLFILFIFERVVVLRSSYIPPIRQPECIRLILPLTISRDTQD